MWQQRQPLSGISQTQGTLSIIATPEVKIKLWNEIGPKAWSEKQSPADTLI